MGATGIRSACLRLELISLSDERKLQIIHLRGFFSLLRYTSERSEGNRLNCFIILHR